MDNLISSLRPVSFVFWGLILVGGSYALWADRTPESSFWVRFLFPALSVSWAAGFVLLVRVGSRRVAGHLKNLGDSDRMPFK